MAKSTRYKCDCLGCSNTVTDPIKCNWFVLSQLPCDKNRDDPKLERELYFCSIHCLQKWSKTADMLLSQMQDSAEQLGYKRGALTNDKVPGLYL